MATIMTLLAEAQLPDSPSARLDAELLLAAALGKPRSFLRTWPERVVDREVRERFEGWLARRRAGEPVAYILGRQGFWSLDLEVAPHTLIPRPDTELLVETALQLLPASPARVLDLGTGTGAIALALACERLSWQVSGVDRIPEAVALAERNRERLRLANVGFRQSHWFSALEGERFALIVGNPPYIPGSDPHLQQGDVRFEPKSALVAGHDGLDDDADRQGEEAGADREQERAGSHRDHGVAGLARQLVEAQRTAQDQRDPEADDGSGEHAGGRQRCQLTERDAPGLAPVEAERAQRRERSATLGRCRDGGEDERGRGVEREHEGGDGEERDDGPHEGRLAQLLEPCRTLGHDDAGQCAVGSQ